jgi:hypothetical protein
MECDLKNEICGFSCTGFEGGQVWKELEKAVNKIDCESCREHAERLISFIHDHVNAGLGKPLFNAKNYHDIVSEINCVSDKTKGEPA